MMSKDPSIHDLRVLTREGIRHGGMNWNSPGFVELRDRIGPQARVVMRIDPTDPGHAFVLDERGRQWVRGDLVMTSVDDGLGCVTPWPVGEKRSRVAERLARSADSLPIALSAQPDIGATTPGDHPGAPSGLPSSPASSKA